MSMLANVTKGKIKKPLLILVYGPDGVGKSSFGADAPAPIFLGPEAGTDNLDVTRFATPKNWTEVRAAVRELIDLQHAYKTLVIDTLDWLEPLLFAKIIKDDAKGAKSMETACGGYGKAYAEAVTEWIHFREDLTEVRMKKGMNIVLLAHSDVVKFDDPETQLKYDRYELKLHKKASAMFREWVDAVLFCNFESFGKKGDGGGAVVFSDGARVMHTERRPARDAKNRFGLPLTLPLSWPAFVEAVEKGNPDSLEAIMSRIDGLLSVIKDEELKGKSQAFIKDANGDVRKLAALANRLALAAGEAA